MGRPASEVSRPGTILAGRSRARGRCHCESPPIHARPSFRTGGGLLYATSPRVDWASLLRRSFSVDVLECPKCRGRLKVVAVITEREPVQRILAHLGLPTDAPPVAPALGRVRVRRQGAGAHSPLIQARLGSH
jgi:hypothetical protein